MGHHLSGPAEIKTDRSTQPMLMIRDLRMVIAPNLDISYGYLHRGPGSEKIVLQQRFVSRIEEKLDADRVYLGSV
jgi:hypothetical protein